MAMSVEQIVREHSAATRKFLKEIKGKPEKARAFLIQAGILDKSGKRLARRYR